MPADTAVASSRPDATLAAAVELARTAAVEVAGDAVGEHQGVTAEGERLVTHRFAAQQPGYRGWHWAVSLARAARSKTATVDEVVLLPGDGALLAPAWVPWSDRVRPGDLAEGDVMATAPDDPRLVPGYVATGDDSVDEAAVDAVVTELALGRPRVLSPEGRDEAADRWSEGERGPEATMATQAPAHCDTCGFRIQLAGALRGAFGVCANEFSPADGQVVALDFGCGAHSEAVAPEPVAEISTADVYDDDAVDITENEPDPAAGSDPDPAAG